MEKFNYIISAYFGKRRARAYNTLNNTEILLDIHLDFFLKNKIELLNRIIIVLNITKNDDINIIKTLKDKYKDLPIHYIIKDNVGGSYYNFEIGLLNSLFLDPDINYSFIIEDDYMPFSLSFYKPFIEKIKKDNYVYVCQMLDAAIGNTGEIYGGISNGVFDMRKIKQFLKKNKQLFDIITTNEKDYTKYQKNQITFTRNLNKYYKITGLCIETRCFINSKNYNSLEKSSGKYSIPFLSEYSLTYYGNITGEILFKPIIFKTYFFRKMQYDDLEFFLSIRNNCKDFLHNNNKFTIEDSRKWFDEVKPYYYIINYDNKDIGYFRTSNYSDNTIYIGADLHKDWRNKKLSYNAYMNFMYFLFDKLNLEKVYLKVLETNMIAYNLYKKLGFIYLSHQKIYRDDKYINSILMSFSKSQFKKEFNISYDKNCFYISTFNKIFTNVHFYDKNNNLLYYTISDFNFNSLWCSFLMINKVKTFKIKITDKNNNTIFSDTIEKKN